MNKLCFLVTVACLGFGSVAAAKTNAVPATIKAREINMLYRATGFSTQIDARYETKAYKGGGHAYVKTTIFAPPRRSAIEPTRGTTWRSVATARVRYNPTTKQQIGKIKMDVQEYAP